MDLQPKHIITTNYDKLIESTENINRMLYEVVRKDEDLLKFQSSNYIIKIQGDILIVFINYYKYYNISNINEFIYTILDKDILKKIQKINLVIYLSYTL